jgi:two-component system, chemotaxis family, chemotaxis protein CheY
VEGSDAARDLIAATAESLTEIQAITTGSGFEALKLLTRYQFDLIITDIVMPDIDGLELINFVKKSPNYRNVPLLVIAEEEQHRQQGLALGAAEYLIKPLDPGSLEVLFRRYLKLG